jgi:hypothetical protein
MIRIDGTIIVFVFSVESFARALRNGNAEEARRSFLGFSWVPLSVFSTSRCGR